MSSSYHTPVLADEVVHYLVTSVDGLYVDGTAGGGGHAEAICRRLQGKGRLVCFDVDDDAIQTTSRRLATFTGRVTFVRANFGNLKGELAAIGRGAINGLLLDLGVSSHQLDDATKGFSFRGDERIDMRMDRRQQLTGWDVVNMYEEERLADILWKYGEERNARRIARAIVKARSIESTRDLAVLLEATVGGKFLLKTFARVFQAIRIEVNDELGNLKRVLTDMLDLLQPSGRVVVISYHSLEDRIVKTAFRNASRDRIPSGHKYIPDAAVTPQLRIVTKSPVLASAEEVARNPRARSAKMRVAERIGG